MRSHCPDHSCPAADCKKSKPFRASHCPDHTDRAKLVLVGDAGVGKTSLLIAHTTGKFPTGYVPTVFETFASTLTAADGRPVELSLWDQAGTEDYPWLRSLMYPDTSVRLVCFSAMDRDSFNSAQEK